MQGHGGRLSRRYDTMLMGRGRGAALRVRAGNHGEQAGFHSARRFVRAPGMFACAGVYTTVVPRAFRLTPVAIPRKAIIRHRSAPRDVLACRLTRATSAVCAEKRVGRFRAAAFRASCAGGGSPCRMPRECARTVPACGQDSAHGPSGRRYRSHDRASSSLLLPPASQAVLTRRDAPMGEKVVADRFDLSDRLRYRRKLRQCLEGLGRLLEERRFDRPRNLMGLEIELNLADADGMPRMMNAEVLQRIASRDFQTELGQFNLEVNIVPHRLQGRVLDQLAEELRTGLAYADRKAREVDAGIVMIGILPTLTGEDLVSANLSDGRPVHAAERPDHGRRGARTSCSTSRAWTGCRYVSQSIAPEAACTSVQLHLQVTPGRFGDVWNAAQAVAGVQIAIGRQLALPLRARAVARVAPAAVPAGHRHPAAGDGRAGRAAAHLVRRALDRARPTTSSRRTCAIFPALLPMCDEEDPLQVLGLRRRARTARTGAAQRHRLPLEPARLRGGRRRAAPAGGEPGAARRAHRHRRAGQHRLLLRPGARTRRRAAARCGRGCRSRPPPPTSRPPAGTASTPNCTGRGADAAAGLATVPAVRLVREELLPLAAAGLDAWGVEAADRDHYLGVIEERCRRRVNGASWQAAAFHRAEESGLGREKALAAMTRRYAELVRAGEPVHTWPARPAEPAAPGRRAEPIAWAGARAAGARGGVEAMCSPRARESRARSRRLAGAAADPRGSSAARRYSSSRCPSARARVSALISFLGSVTAPGSLADQAAHLNVSHAAGPAVAGPGLAALRHRHRPGAGRPRGPPAGPRGRRRAARRGARPAPPAVRPRPGAP